MTPRHPFLFLSLSALLAACGGGGGGGTGPTPPGPITPTQPPSTIPSPAASGLVAAAAGVGAARLDLRLPGSGFEAALFQGGSQSTLYAGTPIQTVAASPVLVTGLTDGVDTFFGLAIRRTGQGQWTPVGSPLRTRPGAPIYVDAAANAAGADGTTPATAFPSLLDALLLAGSQNGRNVWVRDGDYGAGPYPLGSNVHLAGGFGAAFDLATRNVGGGATRLIGSTSQEIVSVQSGGGDGTVDGFVVDGGGTVLKGVDVADSDVELRSLLVRNCADRGVKTLTTLPTPNRHIRIVGCTITGNASDGLSVAGAQDVVLDLSSFDANGQEGVDVDNLDAPDGGTVSLRATGCRFFGNSFEGLDIDLAAGPGLPPTAAGAFVVDVANCSFEVNGLDGLLVDQEHEFFPGFAATIAVRGCIARGNRLAGVHVDADANGTCRLEGLRCTANAGDGVLVTSETNAGEVVLATSWLAGNLGSGARLASGNKTLLASHCGFAGNQNGGLRSDSVACAATDSVFWRQASPLTNAIGGGNVTADGATQVFYNAPNAFTTVAANAQGTLTVADASGFAVGASARAADATTRLVVTQSGGTTIVLDQAPAAFVAPGMLHGYPTSDVVDDLRLPPGSAALAQGIAAPGETPLDAGPHGAPIGGEPGSVDPLAGAALHLLGATPPLATGVTAQEALVLTFDRAIDPATVTADRVVVLTGGLTVPVNLSVNGATLTLAPTGTGWSGSPTLQLRPGIAAADGSPLAAPLLTPIRIR